MQLQKSKKQKQQKQFRESLKTLLLLVDFQVIPQLLRKSYSKIQSLNMIRLCACLQINYLINCYIEIMKKNQSNKLTQDIKIGIIGCGVIGQMILNNILVFTKQGINPANIFISTRDTQKLNIVKSHFNVNVEFNNQKVTEIADILIVATPATLDNWIIVDLVPIITKRIEAKLSKPLIYILTSNFHKQKALKLIKYPVLVPTIVCYLRQQRAQNNQFIETMLNRLKQINWSMEQAEVTNKNRIQLSEELLGYQVFQQSLPNILEAFEKIFIPTKQSSTSSVKSSDTVEILNKASKSQNMIEKMDIAKLMNKEQQLKSGISGTLFAQQTFQNTFKTKCRKWRMAYNNYLA